MAETTILRKYISTIPYKTALQLSSTVGWVNRLALAIVYIWFGAFKIIHLSPAQELVSNLHSVTFVRYIPINIFQVILGYTECLIGILWLIPKFSKAAFIIFSVHIFTTFLPMFWLPDQTWRSAFILTMTGQYIMKNLVLVASAVTVFHDYKKNKSILNLT